MLASTGPETLWFWGNFHLRKDQDDITQFVIENLNTTTEAKTQISLSNGLGGGYFSYNTTGLGIYTDNAPIVLGINI